MGLREVYARARQHNSAEHAARDLAAWKSWARRCRLEPFKKLATTIKERFGVLVLGMLDHRNNAFVESMNGQLRQAEARHADIGRPRPSSPSPTCTCHA